MKLLPLAITEHPRFRERLIAKLEAKLLDTQIKDKTGRSVDGAIRIGRADFLTVPHIRSSTDVTTDEAKIEGSIKANLDLQILVPTAEDEKLQTDQRTVQCSFVVFVTIDSELRNKNPQDYIASFRFQVSELNL
jgi:hypothetical protein